jgi:hypothetical protein
MGTANARRELGRLRRDAEDLALRAGGPRVAELPALQVFLSLPPGEQADVLVGWRPPAAALPPAAEVARMGVAERVRLAEELDEPVRHVLLPYTASLPMAERVWLVQEVARRRPTADVRVLHALREACRLSWAAKRQLVGAAGPDTDDRPA